MSMGDYLKRYRFDTGDTLMGKLACTTCKGEGLRYRGILDPSLDRDMVSFVKMKTTMNLPHSWL